MLTTPELQDHLAHLRRRRRPRPEGDAMTDDITVIWDPE